MKRSAIKAIKAKKTPFEIRHEKARLKIQKEFDDYKKKHGIKGDLFAPEKKKVIVVDKLPNMFTKEQHDDYRKAQKQ